MINNIYKIHNIYNIIFKDIYKDMDFNKAENINNYY